MTTYTVYYRDPELHELVPHPNYTRVAYNELPCTSTRQHNGWILTEDRQSEAETNPKTLRGRLKLDLTLVPPSAIAGMAEALEDGARKYGPYNWRETPVEIRTYLAAVKRHIDHFLDGEECAQDSKVHHLKHAMGSLAVVNDAIDCGTAIDDRPPPGRVSYDRRAAAEAVPEAEFIIEHRYNPLAGWYRASEWPDTYTEVEADRALLEARGLEGDFRKRLVSRC